MRIILTDHAKQRMKLRGVTMGMVKTTIATPDSSDPSNDGRKLVYRKWEGKTLKVVYVIEGSSHIVVVSVIWHDE